MRRQWGRFEYTTELASDNGEGWSALELHRSETWEKVLVARVVFWDAQGQFSLEVRVDELPLGVIEELIAEAKATDQDRMMVQHSDSSASCC